MAVKIFIDANVLLDFTLQREHYEDAKEIMSRVVNNEVQAYITSSVLHIAGYWLSKTYGSAKTKDILLTLLKEIYVIDLPHQIAITALNSRMNDIEDAIQYYAAIHHQIDYFISRDKQLKKDGIAVLPVYSPEEFFNLSD